MPSLPPRFAAPISLCLLGTLVSVPCSLVVAQQRAPVDSAVHVLNRLAFGPRPGEVEHVRKLGVQHWIEQQLHPESLPDSAALAALKGCNMWIEPVRPVPDGDVRMTVDGQVMRVITQNSGPLLLMKRDSARKLGPRGQRFLDNGQLIGCRLARVEASERQLLEVMTDFWHNHFSIHALKLPQRTMVVEWDRAVIQPRALGRFRDLLGAVAHSPAMLVYLDNASSSVPADQPTLPEYLRARTSLPAPARDPNAGLNENYARELLELHTLGVDGGYTQADVIAVARALTGWSRSGFMPVLPGNLTPQERARMLTAMMSASRAEMANGITFRFDSARHDAGPKVVLGQTLPAGRGLEDGEDVLDLLARHPSTAKFIARKLTVRLVSDNPPEALVERAAATFRRTDGDIREVVRTIVTSPEFFAREVYGAKVKSPLELVLSTRRALAAPVDTAAEVVDHLLDLDQPPFGRESPDGWPETGADWMNARTMMARLKFARRIGSGEFAAIPVQAWPAWKGLSTQPFERQVDGVIQNLLHGKATRELRAAMMGLRPKSSDADTEEARQLRLRELITLALGSPAFQRR